MSLSNQQYVESVRRLARQRGQEIDIGDIRAHLNKALQILGDKAANNELSSYLEKDFSAITFASGVASISGQTGLIYEHIRRVTHSDGTTTTEVSMLPLGSSRRDLTYERNQFQFWGVQESNSIYLMAGDGATVPGDGTITLTACFTPLISEVPDRLVDDLIAIGFQIAAGADE